MKKLREWFVLRWRLWRSKPQTNGHIIHFDKDIETELVERVTHKPEAQLRPLRDMDEIKYFMGEEPKGEE